MRKWNKLSSELNNEIVKQYYDILKHKNSSLVMKRFFDIIVSILLIILLFPIFVIIAFLIKLDSSGPIFYRQERITQYNKSFKIIKFRTMKENDENIKSLITIQGDSRITRVGHKIRKYRLDEIPQVINVLLGDMTFVGTRPEVRKYVDMYTDEMKATLLMKAGITSLASIKFKDEDKLISKYTSLNCSIDEIYMEKILPKKMLYNLEYIKKFSFIGDLLIMIQTAIDILK